MAQIAECKLFIVEDDTEGYIIKFLTISSFAWIPVDTAKAVKFHRDSAIDVLDVFCDNLSRKMLIFLFIIPNKERLWQLD